MATSTLKMSLSQSELDKLKVLADFVFFDEFQNYASYPQFEKCFQLLLGEEGISLELVFRQLCGKKRKFLTFPRLIKCYLIYKSSRSKFDPDTKKFFSTLFNKVIKTSKETVLEAPSEKTKSYTSQANKNRNLVSKVSIFTNKDDQIRGIELEYDDLIKSKLYDVSEDGLYTKSELELQTMETNKNAERKLMSLLNCNNEFVTRDGITHIFGTYTTKIDFLGFKTRSGKLYFEGSPKGQGFLYGEPQKQFHYCRFNMANDLSGGMTNLKAVFVDSSRINDALNVKLKEINTAFFKNDPPINEEKQLEKITDEEELQKFIVAAPVIAEDSLAPMSVKLANEENDLETVCKKEEKIYAQNDADEEEVQLNAENLTLEDIINGTDEGKQRLRAGRGRSKGKEKTEEHKKTFKKKKMKPRGKGKGKAAEIMGDKKNYKNLLNKLGKDINESLDQEKARLRSKRKAMEVQQQKMQQENPEEEEQQPTRLRAGRKQKASSGSKNAGIGGFGGFGGFGDFGFGDFGFGSSSSSSSKQTKKSSSSGGFGFGLSDMFNSVESFFDSFGNSSQDDYDQLDNMSNQDLMKMFYNQPQQNTYNQPKQQTSSSKQSGRIQSDPAADQRAQTNWQKIKTEINKKNGFSVIQTIGAVIKATVALEKDESGEKPISLNEKIRLYQILEENESIVDFLSQEVVEEPEPEEEEEPIEKKIPGIEEISTLTMTELNARIMKIDELVKTERNQNNINSLLKIKDACNQRKNKLIKDEEEKARQEMIRQQKINEEAIKKEEEEKRKKAQEEKDKTIANILEQGKAGAMKVVDKIKKEKDGIGFAGQAKMSKVEENKILKAMPSYKHSYRNQQLPKSGTFKDPLFPPQTTSLCDIKNGKWILPPDGIPDDIEGWDKYTWGRAQEIFGHDKFKVFDYDSSKDSMIEDDDIIQGTLGDCYFLSAIAALAAQPVYIERLFYTKDKTNTGAYGVYYLVNGEWKMVVLDDYFPCIQKKVKRWVFSSANGTEIWVMLLEKAWAKLNGTFSRIGCGGQPHEVFECTTDAYSERLNVKKPALSNGKASKSDSQWQKLVRAQENGYIMTAGTGVTDETEEMGLATGHAYTLSHVYDCFPNNESQRIRLVNIRNPWGNGEWTGDYRDDDKKHWTSNLIKEIQRINPSFKFESKDDGEFFMTYEDFCKYYVVMGICHIYNNYEYKTVKISANKKRSGGADADEDIEGRLVDHESGTDGPAITKLEVTADTDIYLRVCQKNMRFKPKTEEHHTKHVLEYIMLLDSKFNYILSECNDEPTTCMKLNLRAGTYYVITDVNYRYIGHNHGYVISSYSKKPVNFSLVKKGSVDIKKIIREAAAQLVKATYNGRQTDKDMDKILPELNKFTTKKPDKLGNGEIEIYSGDAHSKRVPFMTMLFRNTTSDKKAICEMTVSKSKSKKEFEIYCDDEIKPDQEKFSFEIGPNSERAVLINKYEYSSGFGLNYGMTLYGSNTKAPKPGQNDDDIDDNQVFYESSQPIDDKGLINNYYMQLKTGVLLGIDNNTKRDLKMKLDLTGLEISKGPNTGKSNITFNLPKGSRTTFRTKYKQGAKNLSFCFGQA